MKIASVESFVLSVPTPQPMALQYPLQKLVCAQIRTDDGLEGLGYSLVFGGGGAEAVLAYVKRLEPLLIGEDPLFVERLWEKMFRADMGIKKQGVAAYAISALDIGLWDIAGKTAKLPLYKLWGAVSNSIQCYGSGGWSRYSEKQLIQEAERYAAMGCSYYKIKIHHSDPKENAKRVKAVQKALGGKLRMMVDVNQRLDVIGNLRQAQELEDLDLVWYEEPVLADDLVSLQDLSRQIKIPIATGENNYNRWEFADIIDRGAARYLMPDVCRALGYSETMRIGRLAAAHPVYLSPHVVHELSLHVVGALPNGFLVEFIDWAPPDLYEEMPQCKEGRFLIMDRPGHGMTLSKAAIGKYRSA